MDGGLRTISYETRYGPGMVVVRGNAVCAHHLPGSDPKVLRCVSSVRACRGGDRWAPLARELAAYFEGERVHFDKYELDLTGLTPFRRLVYEYVMGVRFGETTTYGQVARAANCRSPRAVGGALAANPVPLFIPCHRVVSARSIGGWSGPLGLKQEMLAIESGRRG